MAELEKLLWVGRAPDRGPWWNALVRPGGTALYPFRRAFRFADSATSFRRQTLFPADHHCYAGDSAFGPNPKLLARIKDADLIR